MQQKTYIAIDLKSFYASVECVERGLDPLTAKLVVADESRTEKTICLAVTPALKAYGLSGRSRLFEVVQKAKEIRRTTGKDLDYIIAKPRMQLYEMYSSRIFRIYLKYVSDEDMHVYSIDEVFIDATQYLTLYGLSAREFAVKMIREVLKETGITATVGIGPNLYLCKIAMDIVAKHCPADESGVRIAELDIMSYRKLLWDHRPLTDFWMIGKGIMKRLEHHGIHTMGDLARASMEEEDWLYREFGVNAELLIDHAWGVESCGMKEIKSYRAEVNSLSSAQVLSVPYPFEKAAIVIREMAVNMALSLLDKHQATSSCTLDIWYDRENVDNGIYDGLISIDYYGRRVPKPAHGTVNFRTHTSDTMKIVEGLVKLYREIADQRLTIRKMNISANNVIKDEYEQLDLFTDQAKTEKERNLQKAVLEVHRKFGKNALVRGVDLMDGATAMERNSQIGGHRA